LSLTDSDGNCGIFCVIGIISGIASLFSHNDILHTIAGIAIGYLFGPGNWLSGLPDAVRGFVGGFIVGGVTGHNLKSALFSGLQALGFAAAGGIKAQFHWADGSIGAILAHGLVGGLITDARGGKFGAGFLAAGVSEAASPYVNLGSRGANTVAHAIVGGAASVLGGGKFANGAITAAFGYLYNSLAHAEAHAQLLAQVRARGILDPTNLTRSDLLLMGQMIYFGDNPAQLLPRGVGISIDVTGRYGIGGTGAITFWKNRNGETKTYLSVGLGLGVGFSGGISIVTSDVDDLSGVAAELSFRKPTIPGVPSGNIILSKNLTGGGGMVGGGGGPGLSVFAGLTGTFEIPLFESDRRR
jgi:hypothetical protein